MFADVGAGGEADSTWGAERRLTVAVLQPRALAGEAVDMFRSNSRMSIAAEVVGPHLVGCDDEQIQTISRLFRWDCSGVRGGAVKKIELRVSLNELSHLCSRTS